MLNAEHKRERQMVERGESRKEKEMKKDMWGKLT